MDSDAIIGIVVFAGLIIVIAAIIGSRRKRRGAIESWASSHGWSYQRNDNSILRQWHSPTISRGISQHVLRRTTSAGEVLSLENYQQSSGSATTQQIVGLDLGFPMPTTLILKASPQDRGYREYTPVATPSSDFNQHWRVLAENSDDVGRIQQLLSSRFTARMVQDQELIGRAEFTVEGHHLLVILPGAQQVERIEPALNLLSDLAQSLRHSHDPR